MRRGASSSTAATGADGWFQLPLEGTADGVHVTTAKDGYLPQTLAWTKGEMLIVLLERSK